MYMLYAVTRDGASVIKFGENIDGLIKDFDAEYKRKGFRIWVVNKETGKNVLSVKKSYR